jgi:hypothetical protein
MGQKFSRSKTTSGKSVTFNKRTGKTTTSWVDKSSKTKFTTVSGKSGIKKTKLK